MNYRDNVQRQSIAKPMVEDIQDICMELMIEAGADGFLRQQPEDVRAQANEFVQRVADRHSLRVRSVGELRWSFEDRQDQLFDDGLVELHVDSETNTYFGFVDGSNAEITDPRTTRNAKLFRSGKVADIKEAYYLRMVRRIGRWKQELKCLSVQERKRFDYMLIRTEETLETLKLQVGTRWDRTRTTLEEWVRLTDRQIDEVRNRLRNS